MYGHVITKFSRMGKLPHFLSYGAPPTRGAPLILFLKYILIQSFSSDQAQQTYVYKGHTGGENLFSSRIKEIVNYCVFEKFCCSHKGGFIFD